jgi:hypothetical protein
MVDFVWGYRKRVEKELAELREQIAKIAEALTKAPEAAPLAESLVKSMGEVLAAQATQQPQMFNSLFEHVGKMMDLVRRDAARQMGREGGRRSAAGRGKRKAHETAVERIREFAAQCTECNYNLHRVDWTERGDNRDYNRHHEEHHDDQIAEILRGRAADHQRGSPQCLTVKAAAGFLAAAGAVRCCKSYRGWPAAVGRGRRC